MLASHLASLPASPNSLAFTAPGGGGTSRRPAGDPTNPVRHELFRRRVFAPAVKTTLPPEKHGVRRHDLRHTCAALLIAAGRHPLEIKTRLGHPSIATTMDRYGWLFPSAEAALADALDATYDAAAPVVPLDSLSEAVA